MLDADAACSHFDDGCTAVQVGDVNARRRLSLAVLVCDNHMHGNLGQAVGRVTAAWTGPCLDRSLQSSSKSLQPGALRALARILCSVEQRGT